MPTELLDRLLDKLGRFIFEVTNRPIVLVGEDVLPKMTVPYCVIEESVGMTPTWHSNEACDSITGNMSLAYNGQFSVIVTMGKDDPRGTVNRRTALGDAINVINAFSAPYTSSKYFSEGDISYSSSVSPTKQKVSIDSQAYENRARFVVTFNVCWTNNDYGAFEKLEKVKVTSRVTDANSIIINVRETKL